MSHNRPTVASPYTPPAAPASSGAAHAVRGSLPKRAGDLDVAEVRGSGDRTARHRRGVPGPGPRGPDDGPDGACRRRRAIDASRTAGPARPGRFRLRAVRGSAPSADPESVPSEETLNMGAVSHLHGLFQQPGGGQQAGPDSLPTPSQRPTPTGRLLVAEALPSRRSPPRALKNVQSAALVAALLVFTAACSRPAQQGAFERPPA